MTDEVGDFLAHYGVKGMRWGVRHDRNEVDRAKPKQDRNKPDLLRSKFGTMTLADLKKLSKRKKKNESELTDDEIIEELDDPDLEGGD
jgi:hypothetical protein